MVAKGAREADLINLSATATLQSMETISGMAVSPAFVYRLILCH